jgi:urease accessory protein
MPLNIAEASRLLLWFSPSFPTGAFAYSHGLEWAVEAGDVTDRGSLTDWVGAILEHGAGSSDAVLLAASHRAVLDHDEAGLAEIAELALALQPSLERRSETVVQGEAFLRAVRSGWPDIGAALPSAANGPVALAIAVGTASGAAGLALEPVLTAFLTGFAQNLVSAAIRLAPIGQSDGVRVLAALEPVIAKVAGAAAVGSLADLGTFALRADIASMRHETQTTRLFRS